MNIVLRKCLTAVQALQSPSQIPSLIRRNLLSIRGFITGDRPFVYQTSSGTPFVCIPDCEASRRVFLCNYQEEVELQLAIAWLEEGDCCIDVGANVGVFTALFAKVVGPQGTVLAFEPSPEAFAWLVESINALKLTNVIPLAACASDQNDVVAFHTTSAPDVTQVEGSMRVVPEHAEKFRRTLVPSVTIDRAVSRLSENKPLSLLKIDAEGADVLVMNGAADLIESASPPFVIVELHQELLANFGFTLTDVLCRVPETKFHRFMIPRSVGDTHPGRQHGKVYAVTATTDWPVYSNLVALPKNGTLARRIARIESMLPFHSSVPI